MMKQYLMITNVPSFYKVRLYSKIAQSCFLSVIFFGKTKEQRNADFFGNDGSFEILSSHSSLLSFIFTLISIKNKRDLKVVLGGWNDLKYWISLLFFPRKQLCCVVESSIVESSRSGIKYFFKWLFLSRMNEVLVPGLLHKKLIQELGYSGKIVISGGCGLLNYIDQPKYEERHRVTNFVYVGRLSQEKNLEKLITTFNGFPQLQLNIVGFGPLESELKALSNSNVKFWGAVPNKELTEIYQHNDVLVLPSFSETWGLVIEEALNNGLPVIVSDRVGCKDDLVRKDTGLVFNLNDTDGLKNCINKMLNIEFYNGLRKGVANLNFDYRANQQVQSYIEICK